MVGYEDRLTPRRACAPSKEAVEKRLLLKWSPVAELEAACATGAAVRVSSAFLNLRFVVAMASGIFSIVSVHQMLLLEVEPVDCEAAWDERAMGGAERATSAYQNLRLVEGSCGGTLAAGGGACRLRGGFCCVEGAMSRSEPPG